MLDRSARLLAVQAARVAVHGEHAALDRLTRLATRLLGVRFGFLSLVAHDIEVLTAVVAPEGESLPEELPYAHSLCQHLVRRGAPLLVPDLQTAPELAGLVEVQALGMRSYAGFPVRSREGHVLGGLCVAHDEPRAWSEVDAVLLAGLAEAAAGEIAALVALEELARARDDERRRAEEQAALHRIAASVARGAPPQQVLDQAAAELVRLLDARTALVLRFLPDGGTQVLASAGRGGPSEDAGPWFAHVLARVRATGASVTAELEDRPCAVAPVVVAGRTWGALLLVLGPGGSAGQVEQLAQLADFVALVLSNAEAQVQLTRLATTDPLTGAANRRLFEERLRDALRRCGRDGGAVLVALLDLDLFKQVNDEHGHQVGDEVLRAFAARVGSCLREVDLLARLGGDEWALLVPDVADDPHAVLERVRASVAAAPLAGVPVTVTVGAAVAEPGCTPVRAVREADVALYEAKRRGRDRVAVFPSVSP